MANKLGYRDGGRTSEEGINRISSRVLSNAGILTDDSLNVAQAGTPDNTVEVAVGDIIIGSNSPNNTLADYYYHGWVDTAHAETVTANASGNPRIDIIVALVDLTVVSTASSDNPGALDFVVVEGTPAATPVAPTDSEIQTAVGASNPWMPLAHIAVSNGFSTITDADITDLRQRALTPDYLVDKATADFVGEGLVWSQSSGLIGQMTSGIAFINGKPITKGYLIKTFTASKDTYVDIPNTAKPTSTDELTYTEVTLGNSAPALASDSIRVAKVVTDGSGITGATTSGLDSNGVPIRSTASIDTLQIVPEAVTTPKILNDAVTAEKIDWAAKGADAGIWWEEIGRTTLTVAGGNISIASLPARKYLMLQIHVIGAGTVGIAIQFNNDTGNNYTRRSSNNGGAEATQVSSARSSSGVTLDSGESAFGIVDIVNVATRVKFIVGSIVTDGAGVAVSVANDRNEWTGKWVNTADLISEIDINADTGADFAIGSEVVVLGHN